MILGRVPKGLWVCLPGCTLMWPRYVFSLCVQKGSSRKSQTSRHLGLKNWPYSVILVAGNSEQVASLLRLSFLTRKHGQITVSSSYHCFMR